MHPYLLLLFVALVLGPSVSRAQDATPSTPAPTTTNPAETPVSPAAEKPSVSVDAAISQIVDAVTHETKNAAREEAAPAPAAVEAAPVAAVAPAEAAPSVVSAAMPAPVAPAPAAPAVESRAELLTARISLMEQLLLAQHDREVTLYRDTIRLVTIFGGAFAGLCMIGLLAAAFLNYRALVAIQGMYTRVQNGSLPGAANGMLPAPAAVPGIERVQASGQRFQSRMTGLEERLSELEHLAGRESPPVAAGEVVRADVRPPTAEEVSLIPPPAPVIPRAMILVHKAQTLANLGKLSEALFTLDEASASGGAKAEIHLARGQVLEKLGRLGDALKAYDTAVDEDDHNTSALLLKAGVLNRQERFSEALACYERALEVHRAAV
jgi:tetratricopeptide (TPR) repeat protein